MPSALAAPVMSRVILAPKERLTHFDLRAQIFRVNVELSAYNRGQKKFRKNDRKWPVGSKKIFIQVFLKPSVLDHWWPKRYKKKFFRTVRVLSVIFSIFFSISVAKMSIDGLHFDRKSWLIMKFPFIILGTRDGFSWDTSASRVNSDIGRAIFPKKQTEVDTGRRRTESL